MELAGAEGVEQVFLEARQVPVGSTAAMDGPFDLLSSRKVLARGVCIALQILAFLSQPLGDLHSLLVIFRGFLLLHRMHELRYDLSRLCSTA